MAQFPDGGGHVRWDCLRNAVERCYARSGAVRTRARCDRSHVPSPLDPVPARAAVAAPGEDDLELVAQALAGSPPAVADLCERLACVPRMIHGLNARMNRPLGAEDQRDLCQQVLALTWRKLSQFNGQAALESWVLGIVRFELLNVARSLRRRPESAAEEGLESAPARTSETAVDGERIADALARLDAGDARIIRLHLFDERSFEEVAAHLGLTPSAARNRYYRALQGLRVRLGSLAPWGAK
jgi:RNA polymerase sigma-70 factor, ECF subfamily